MATDGVFTETVPGLGDTGGNDIPEMAENFLFTKIFFGAFGMAVIPPGQTSAQSTDIPHQTNPKRILRTELSSPAGGTVYGTGTYTYDSNDVLQYVSWTFTALPGKTFKISFNYSNGKYVSTKFELI